MNGNNFLSSSTSSNKVFGPLSSSSRSLSSSDNVNIQHSEELVTKETTNTFFDQGVSYSDTSRTSTVLEREGEDLGVTDGEYLDDDAIATNSMEWTEYFDETHQLPYWYNVATNETTWDNPCVYR